MYNNIGGKIKGLAIAVFTIEAILAVFMGVAYIVSSIVSQNAYNSEIMLLIGVLIAVFGPVVAWISTWLLYGFGELIEKTTDIREKVCSGE